eukprot:SAG31_NODE_9071_length_1340_cov_1.358582_3_plen_150_part_00
MPLLDVLVFILTTILLNYGCKFKSMQFRPTRPVDSKFRPRTQRRPGTPLNALAHLAVLALSQVCALTGAALVCRQIVPKLIMDMASGDAEKYKLVLELTNPETREGALLELSKRRESFGDLAPILWHSFGTMAALLQVTSAATATHGQN